MRSEKADDVYMGWQVVDHWDIQRFTSSWINQVHMHAGEFEYLNWC